MNRFITIQQTPVYRQQGATYVPSGSFPIATELDFVKVQKNANGRDVGTLADGRVMFIDTLAPLLEDKVKVKATRIYPWLLLSALVVIALAYEGNFKSKS
ncbi:MAG: hypothetical protein ACK52I_22205 [Pseudomonadota bacterium]|jgi:hypothetical protein